MENNPAYNQLDPGTEAHREFIINSIKTNDTVKLEALKNKTDRPIRVVKSWFLYALINQDEEADVAVTYTPEAMDNLTKATNFLKSNQ